MAFHHQPRDHDNSDPTLPCGSCRKRHVRSDAAPRSSSSNSNKKVSTRYHAVATIAALAVATVSRTPHGLVSAVAPIPRRGALSPWFDLQVREMFHMTRRLEATAEDDAHLFEDDNSDHDHGEVAAVVEDKQDDHSDHDHGEGEATGAPEEDQDDHDGHDHGEEVVVVEDDHDDHDGHDHGGTTAVVEDDHDNHSGYDRGGEANHDDHSGHDHADTEFDSVSSANDSVSEKLPWGAVIGASLLVNLAALSGVIIVVMTAIHRGVLKYQGKDASDAVVGHGKLFDICIPAFAVGALIATAVFLIFPEALHLLEGAHADRDDEGDSHEGHDHRYLQEDSHAGHDDSSESANAAKFGCAILGGFLLPMLFSIFFHHGPEDVEAATVSGGNEGGCDICDPADAETGLSDTVATAVDISSRFGSGARAAVQKIEEDSPPEGFCEEERPAASPNQSVQELAPRVNRQLCASILLGDAFHNFADGIFIGAAFKSCSTGVAVSIVFVTLFHEIAQELADFVLLTQYAALSIVMACVLNFLSGLSVCLGGVVFLATNPTDQATGIILAMAGGVYFNVACCETVPRIENIVKGRVDRILTLFSVIVGTVPIGLILLNHQHC